jgi:hypothetical protein
MVKTTRIVKEEEIINGGTRRRLFGKKVISRRYRARRYRERAYYVNLFEFLLYDYNAT